MGALAVPHEPASAAVVRHAIADDLAAHAVTSSTVDDVLLVASELVGNAVLHAGSNGSDGPGGAPAGSELVVSWDVASDAVTVSVADGSLAQPHLRQAGPNAATGRGLAIVNALAEEWGVRPSADGKQVWARVRVHRDIPARVER